MIRVLRFTWLILAVLIALSTAPVAGQAQITLSSEEQEFLDLVRRVETALEANQVSDRTLGELRRELSEWRSRMDSARNVNSTSIGAVLSQLDALGPPPAEGESEPQSVAEVRAVLTERLEELQVPVRRADVAFNRADALISEVDQLLRERQTQEILERVTSPLWLSVWTNAFVELGEVDFGVAQEVRRAWSAPATGTEMRQRLPISIALIVAGLLLTVGGRRLTERITQHMQTRTNAGAQLLAFLISLLQILIPAAGLILIFAAANFLFDTGTLTDALLRGLLAAGLVLIAARWLATRVFPISDMVEAVFDLSEQNRAKGRRLTLLLGIGLALAALLETVLDAFRLSGDTASAINSLVVLFMAYTLWRMAGLLREVRRTVEIDEDGEEVSEPTFELRALWTISSAMHIVAILAPLAAAVGYWRLSGYLVSGTSATLGVFAFLAIMHQVFRDIYIVLTGKDSDAGAQALVPVLLTLALSIGAIPLIAVIWGARWTGVAEAWSVLQSGVRIGETQIGLNSVFMIVIVFLIGFALTRAVQATLNTAVLPRTNIDKGGRNAISAGIGYVGVTLAAVAAITVAGVDLSGIALIASALTVGIGFGLQTIASNFISGLILLAERPISEGDWIEVNGQMGIVRDISVRSTRIETFDRTDVIVPNSDFISGTVTNWTRGNTIGRVIVTVGVAYASDSKKVEAILKEVAEAHPLVAINPAPVILFRNFGADALEFEARCILRDVNYLMLVHSDLNHEIHRRFREEGIEIPFAQRDLWLRNPEALARPAEA